MSFMLARLVVLLAVGSMLINQQYMLNKVSVNQNTPKVGLSLINWRKCDRRLAGT